MQDMSQFDPNKLLAFLAFIVAWLVVLTIWQALK
jgi:hypothetical protein